MAHCWQYEVRKQNLDEDIKLAGLNLTEISSLKVSDFEFQYVPKTNELQCQKIKAFIERHEWLGKMPHRPTHRFIATYKGHLAGVIVMATPNAFSNLLGKENKHKEKLISRGACNSWSPKNLASALIMFSIRWMVNHTEFRYFTAYSDTEARELGTIYQACNFIYLGQKSGSRFQYFDPTVPEKGWFCSRNFRKSSAFKRYAAENQIKWEKSWSSRDKIYWNKIPKEIAEKLKSASKEHQNRCEKRKLSPKHKYVYLLGRTKAETKKLRKKFEQLNPNLINLSYPKVRGPLLCGHAQNGSLHENLTKRPQPCWPTKEDRIIPLKKLYSIKEVSNMYGMSGWLIYNHIKSDATFPFVNVGMKKKYLINIEKLETWLEKRSQNSKVEEFNLPETQELLEWGL